MFVVLVRASEHLDSLQGISIIVERTSCIWRYGWFGSGVNGGSNGERGQGRSWNLARVLRS